MTITVEIPDDIEKRIQENVACGDIQAARQLLIETVFPAVEAAVIDRGTPPPMSSKEFEALLDKLADMSEKLIDPNCPPLSDYALSREGIYGDHPKV